VKSFSVKKLMCRIGITAVLASSVGALGGQPAGATAASPITYSSCFGPQVLRCMNIQFDDALNRVRATSGIRDMPGGRNFSVATSNVRLQTLSNGTWVNIRASLANDYDGWHAEVDSAGGGNLVCPDNSGRWLRTVAFFQWSGGSAWYAGKAKYVIC